MAKRVALLLVALIYFSSCSLTSKISSRLFLPSSLPTHAAAASRPLRPAPEQLQLRPAVMPPALYPAAGSPEDRGSSGYGVTCLTITAVALALRRLATPVATCATDGYND